MNAMDHSEAVEQMAAERYVLDELPPGQRDAFEEHLFDCPECALDVRTEGAFMDEAKLQLPGMVAASPSLPEARPIRPAVDKRDWLAWIRPVFANPLVAMPVFATLLLVVGYQNFVTYPALRAALNEPRLTTLTSLHTGTRGSEKIVIEADR